MKWQADFANSKAQPFLRLAANPPDRSLHLVILAAHPDDETLGASLVLARFPSSRIVYLTDGAPRDPHLWPPSMRGAREDYAELRRSEVARVLAHVGISTEQVFWLGGTDQEAIFDIRTLAARLGELLRAWRMDLLITHPYEGGHPDHDSAALVARLAARSLGREAPVISEMTSYHVRNRRCVTGEFLNPEPASEIALELKEDDRGRKRRMLDDYRSQRLVLENFPLVAERFRIAPAYDFSHPPHNGRLWYECMGWAMTGARWRQVALAATEQAQGCS
jgi:LmbE family N-acetylglucosaminyl deacetylase